MSGDFKVGADGMPEYELVAERVTDSGITIRALRGESWLLGRDDRSPTPTGGVPHAWCYGDAELRIGLSGPGLIDVTSATWYSELHTQVAVSATHAGWADGQPIGGHRRAGRRRRHRRRRDVGRRVRPRRADRRRGRSAVAGHRPVRRRLHGRDHRRVGHPHPDRLRAEPDRTRPSGARRANRRRRHCPKPASSRPTRRPPRPRCATSSRRCSARRPRSRSSPPDCSTTTPASPPQSRWRGTATTPTRWRRRSTRSRTSCSPAPPRPGSGTRSTPATSYFSQRYGTAHLIDGSWRISRAVICQDLALAGAPCEPDPGPIYPESWYDMYGSRVEGCMEGEGGETLCSAIAESKPNERTRCPPRLPLRLTANRGSCAAD